MIKSKLYVAISIVLVQNKITEADFFFKIPKYTFETDFAI